MTKEEVIEIIEEGNMDMVEAFEFIEGNTDLNPTEIISELF